MSAPTYDQAASAPAPRPRRRLDVPLLVFIGVVALVLVVSGIASAAIRDAADKPVDVARDYLQALADADAARALSYTADVPADTTLLSDAVLASSRQRAPLTGIEATADPSSEEAVDVRYRLGDTSVTDHYTFTRVGGVWKLDRAAVAVDFLPIFDARLPVVVNGTPVEDSGTYAFPVSYAVTTGLRGVDWGPNSTTTVDLAQGVNNLDLEPRLTDVGRREFVTGAKKLISTCVGKRDLAPQGCPFGFRQPSSGPRIPDSTVRWQVKGDPWSKLGDPEIDSVVDPGTAKARVSMTFTCTCRFSTGEACRPQDVTNRVVFAGDVTRDPVEVQLAPF